MAKEEAVKAKVKRPTAEKRNLQHEKRRLRNKSFKSAVRTAIRDLEETLLKQDAEKVKESLSLVYSMMDKGVKKGVYHLNKASRTKARLSAHVVKAAVAK